MLRLYAENTQAVRKIVDRSIHKGLDCTRYKGNGSYKGESERSLIIETTDDNLPKIRSLATSITTDTMQEAVLLVRVASEVLDPICG